ncbi:MAG: acyltransferase [Candidatus Saccharibacteria bacterium]|nr:acyltransferase [Moraxellaceae bacterium]
MNPLSPIPAIASILTAVVTAFFLSRRFGGPNEQDRFASIDGLRGYLAFFVFLHHSSLWYFFLHTGKWELPTSNLYRHFGQSSVALFFMITGFLFFSKLINSRTRKIDWLQLFVSRFMRLVPLYLAAMIMLFIIIAIASQGTLSEPPIALIKNCIKWLIFTVPGAPEINRIGQTWQIVAGVTWSLPYEWFFYFSLPLLAIVMGRSVPVGAITIALVGLISMLLWPKDLDMFWSFAGGVVAAYFVRIEKLRQFSSTPMASLLVVGILTLVVLCFERAYMAAPLILLTLAFILIASSTNLFGILTWKPSLFLGEQAYSLYLLHGVVLYVTMNYVIGLDTARTISPIIYWSIVVALTPILIFLCYLTCRYIEIPGMNRTKYITAWVRKIYIGAKSQIFQLPS